MISLLEAAWWVNRFERPDLDTAPYETAVDAMAARLRDAATAEGGAVELAAGLRMVMHVTHGFRGDEQDYHDPDNSYLDRVMDRRRGIPISLSILAVEIVRRAGHVAEGIAFPGHFLVRLEAGGTRCLVDPFGGCLVVTDADLRGLLARVMGAGSMVTAAMTAPAPPAAVARRMLNNLKGNYLRSGDLTRALRTLDAILTLAPDDPVERRDRGLVREALEHDGGALDDFEAFLDALPDADDANAIRARLAPLRIRLSQWN
ncbi:MAG TPA: tetratricopeptide repeat protein [Candidatus Eisenbacteria bacterium]